jgi:hypothetical protein
MAIHVATIRHAQLAAIAHIRQVVARYRALAKNPGTFAIYFERPPLKQASIVSLVAARYVNPGHSNYLLAEFIDNFQLRKAVPTYPVLAFVQISWPDESKDAKESRSYL